MTLEQAQKLVDELAPRDQVRLLEYLTSRIVRTRAPSPSAKPVGPANKDGWAEFFRIGDEIAAGDTPGTPTLTAAVIAMRR
ncbi:MAG: hypothetical protein FJ279_09450 [Planctomycetes bacterium]|nr:hypothetical protein [Planctomycetota bacterium]MBM4083667.1 hypothetical protein [Planctomycetota bacterium]